MSIRALTLMSLSLLYCVIGLAATSQSPTCDSTKAEGSPTPLGNKAIATIGSVADQLGSRPSIVINERTCYLIPELLSLSDWSVVPSNIYTKYDSRLIAATLVYRLHDHREKSDNASIPETNFKERTILQMRFPPEYISSIAQKGFLNQHQLGHSRGDFKRQSRAETEDRMIGVRLEDHYEENNDNPTNFVRPKYAFLGFDKDSNGQQHSQMEDAHYGQAIAVFKDEVKDRATFTPQDSLGTNGRTTHTLNYRSKARMDLIDSYWEAEIWGKVTLKDVAYIMINCPREPQMPDAQLTSIKATGLPIFKCEYTQDKSHIEKGQLIYSGSSSRGLSNNEPLSGTDTAQLCVDR